MGIAIYNITSERVINYFAAVVLLLFPALSVTVKHAASGGYGLLVLLSLVYGWKGWKDLESHERHILVAFVALCLFAALSLVNASDLSASFKKLSKFDSVLVFVPVYLMLRRSRFDPRPYVFPALMLGIVVLAAFSIYQVEYLGKARAFGAAHPIIFGDVAALLGVLLSAYLIFVSKNRVFRFVGIFVVMAALYAVVLSGTRGAMLVIPFFIFLYLLLHRKEMRKVHWLFVGAVLSIVAIISLYPESPIHKRFMVGVNEVKIYMDNPKRDGSWSLRLKMWQNSIKIAENSSWLVGTGLGDYGHDARALVESRDSQTKHPIAYQHTAHNSYFHAIAETGLLGLCAFLAAFIVMPARYFWLQYSRATCNWNSAFSFGGMAAIGAFAIFGLSTTWHMTNTFMNIYMLFLLYLMLGSASAHQQDDVKNNKSYI